jgi:soluble lytic murein transglycosylase-like protein
MKKNEIILIIIAGIIIIMLFTQKVIQKIKASVVDNFDTYIQAASAKYDVPAERIKAHIVVESEGNPNAEGKALPIHERGLMQLKPGALTDSDKVSHAGYTFDDMWIPEKNIVAGTAYLKWIEKYFFPGDWDKVSRAYNQGVGNPDSIAAYTYLAKINLVLFV